MSSINQLSSDDSLSQGDLVPIYSNGNGSTRKATAAAFVNVIGDSYVTQAQAQANAATLTVSTFQNLVYPGVYAVAPTTRPNGSAMQDGDRAVILLGGTPTEYLRSGGSWIIANVGAANLALPSGSSLVGFIQAGAGATPRTVQDKARESVSVKDFGAKGDGVTDDSVAFQAAINFAKSNAPYKRCVFVPSGHYIVTLVSCPESIEIAGEGSRRTLVTGRWEFLDPTYGGGSAQQGLAIRDIGFENPTGVAVRVQGFYDVELTNIRMQNCGSDGLRLESTFMTKILGFQGGGCGLTTANCAVIRWVRTATGNTLFIDKAYISGSIGADGIKADALQAVCIQNSIIESVDRGVNLGTTATTSRAICLKNVYFENVAVSCGEFNSCFGVTLEDIYVNHQGPRSPVVVRSFYFDNCDFVNGRNLRLDFPAASYGNTAFLAPIEVNTYGIDWIPFDMRISHASNMGTVCVGNSGASRRAIDTLQNTLGIIGVAPQGFDYVKASTSILTSADITTWTSTGGGSPSVSKTAGAFFDGNDLFTITATANSGYLNQVVVSTAAGDPLCFAVMAVGECRVRLRGRRTSDGVFEDVGVQPVSLVAGNASANTYRMVVVSNLGASAYNLLQAIVTTSTSCKVARPKLVLDRMPGKMTA